MGLTHLRSIGNPNARSFDAMAPQLWERFLSVMLEVSGHPSLRISALTLPYWKALLSHETVTKGVFAFHHCLGFRFPQYHFS